MVEIMVGRRRDVAAPGLHRIPHTAAAAKAKAAAAKAAARTTRIIKHLLHGGAAKPGDASASPQVSSRSVLLRPPASKRSGGTRSLNRCRARVGRRLTNQHFCCTAAMNRAATGTSRGTCGRFSRAGAGSRRQLVGNARDQPHPGARHPAGRARPVIIAPPRDRPRDAAPFGRLTAFVIDDSEPALVVAARADEEFGARRRAGRSPRPARTARRGPARAPPPARSRVAPRAVQAAKPGPCSPIRTGVAPPSSGAAASPRT